MPPAPDSTNPVAQVMYECYQKMEQKSIYCRERVTHELPALGNSASRLKRHYAGSKIRHLEIALTAKYSRSISAHTLERAAFLELFLPNQGQENFNLSPLNLVVSAGEQEFIEDVDVSFRLRFRRIIIDLVLSNCTIARLGRYEKTLTEDQVSIFREKLSLHKSTSSEELAGVANLAVAHKILKVGMDVSRKRGRQSDDQDKDNLSQKISIKIVTKSSGPTWEIGHEVLGDPRQFDALLKGDYLLEAPDRPLDEEDNPLCFLEPMDTSKPYSALVEMRVKKRDCVYFPLAENRDLADWRERNKRAIEGALVGKMLEAHKVGVGSRPPPGEIVLARAAIQVEAADD
ncbi:hypothetical protein [Yoonia sp. BS5-3]|uniref:Uncharacterized protein n=1 Tax=Yoonia phaeophyticola TaxID=3137369 RepID=A0ABZ2V2N8_9RHOB